MGNTLEYYAYLSEHTIERLFEQIPEKALPQIAVELGFDLKILTAKVTVSPNEKQGTLTARLKTVVRYLEKHEAGDIGTIDNPGKYIKGTLPMYSYFLPQGFGVSRDAKPELIYFGSSTDKTIVGLAGAASHVFIDTNGRMSPISSALPHLVKIIDKGSGVTPSHPHFREPLYSENSTLQALINMEYMERYNRKEDEMQSYSFIAKVKLNKMKETRYKGNMRFVIASPLYVAHAS